MRTIGIGALMDKNLILLNSLRLLVKFEIAIFCRKKKKRERERTKLIFQSQKWKDEKYEIGRFGERRLNHYRKKAISHCHRPITHSTGSGAFHENPDSRNDCAGQGRRYPDNGHATWSKTEFHCSSCPYIQMHRKKKNVPPRLSWFIYEILHSYRSRFQVLKSLAS